MAGELRTRIAIARARLRHLYMDLSPRWRTRREGLSEDCGHAVDLVVESCGCDSSRSRIERSSRRKRPTRLVALELHWHSVRRLYLSIRVEVHGCASGTMGLTRHHPVLQGWVFWLQASRTSRGRMHRGMLVVARSRAGNASAICRRLEYGGAHNAGRSGPDDRVGRAGVVEWRVRRQGDVLECRARWLVGRRW